MSGNFFGSLSGFFGDIGRARAASALYTDLSGLSDNALKTRGLKRSDLPSYAFGKSFNGK